MESRAYLKYARISPRKVQIVLDLIRGKDAGEAMAILKKVMAQKALDFQLVFLINLTQNMKV